MMFVLAIFFGIVQGLTEFLPISSSAHLFLFHDLFKFDFLDSLAFDAVLHLGTLLALLLFFWPDIWSLFKGWLRSLKHYEATDYYQKLSWLIIVAAIPAGIFGFLAESYLEKIFRNSLSIALALAIVGLAFFLIEKKYKPGLSLEQLTWRQALVIGGAQVLALIPGVSRSGITIIAGMAQKLNRQAAARFSFLLSVPVIAGAGLKKFFDLWQMGINSEQWLILLLSLVAAVVSGYWAIKFLLKYLEKRSLAVFGWYRLILAALIIVILVVGRI